MPLHERALSYRSVSVYTGITWFLWLALLAALVWAANRGLSFGDEGFLLLGYKYPSETHYSTTHFALIVNRLFGWMVPGVVTFRLLKLFLGVGSVTVFAAGLSGWLRGMTPDARIPWAQFSILLPFVAIGDLFGYASFGQPLSYNSLNDNVLLVCSGLLLLSIAGTRAMSLGRGGACVLVGALAGFDFFVKFSSSAVFICACVMAVLLLSRGIRWPERVLRAALLACGYTAGMGLFFLVFLPFSIWLVYFRSCLKSLSGASHNPHVLLGNSVAGATLLLTMLALQALMSGLLFYLASRLMVNSTHSRVARLMTLLTVLLVYVGLTVLATAESVQLSSGAWGTVLGVAGIIAANTALLVVCLLQSRSGLPGLIARHRHAIGVTLFLFATPFLGTLGSNVPLAAAANQYMAFWFATIAVLLLATPRLPRVCAILPAFWAVPLALVAALLAQGLVLHPFEVPRSLFAQTDVLAQVGDLRFLQVDGDTKRIVQGVRGIIARSTAFRPGDPIVAAYDLPGLVYALGGVSPGAPTYYGDADEQQRNCDEVRSTHLKNLDRSIVIARSRMWPSFSACLRSIAIAFPGRYRLAGMVRSPLDGTLIRVFVPRVHDATADRKMADAVLRRDP